MLVVTSSCFKFVTFFDPPPWPRLKKRGKGSFEGTRNGTKKGTRIGGKRGASFGKDEEGERPFGFSCWTNRVPFAKKRSEKAPMEYRGNRPLIVIHHFGSFFLKKKQQEALRDSAKGDG